jgi:Arc/MetJ family transcription regulator
MYFSRMKLTLNIDDDLLSRVMETTGAKTKTEAIHAALAEIDRRHKLIALLGEDIGINWETDIDESSWAEQTVRVAETPAAHDRKPRPRR